MASFIFLNLELNMKMFLRYKHFPCINFKAHIGAMIYHICDYQNKEFISANIDDVTFTIKNYGKNMWIDNHGLCVNGDYPIVFEKEHLRLPIFIDNDIFERVMLPYAEKIVQFFKNEKII